MLKKILLLITFLACQAFAQETLQDVGIAKYAVLEVNKNYTPIRTKTHENGKRLTHLFKDSVLFADKQSGNYYRVELDENNYGWINKKFVDVQAIIPEKRLENIEKITFKELEDRYQIKIQIPNFSAYIFKENEKNLSFSLYDNRFDPTEIFISNISSNFVIPNKIQNDFGFEYKLEKAPFGYGIEKVEKGYLITVKKPPKINPKKPLKNIKIVLDPGHGADELGAVAFNLNEKDINLEISKKLKKELKKRGAKVYMTRTRDKKVGLYERVDFALEKDADILLSIHQNSLPNRQDVIKKHGTGTYYYHKQAKPLAEAIKNSMVEKTGFRDDGVNYASFVLTRPTMPVSVLVECGYIIHQEEANKLVDKNFQKIIARAISNGVEKYLRENF